MDALKRGFVALLFFALSGVAKASAPVATVYVFLAESCPICQSATIGLKNLYREYHEKGVAFVGVFPNITVSNAATIEKFAKKYQLPFPLVLDDNQQWTIRFSATVTPQVFVVKEADGETVYRGKIDNGFERVGKRRQVINEFYLKNALDELLSNRPVAVKETEPVGCFIIKK